MKPALAILQDFLVETIGPPFLSPQRDRDDFPESINLQSATPHCAYDAGIVDDLDSNAELYSTKIEVGVGGSAESVPNYQKRVVPLCVFGNPLKKFVDFHLAKISIGFNDLDS